MAGDILKPKAPPIAAEDLCAHLRADVPAGARGRVITGINTLEDAGESEVSFIQRDKFRAAAEVSRAGLLLAPESLRMTGPNIVPLRDVMDGVLTVLEYFFPTPAPKEFVHPTAVVAGSAQLGASVYVGPHVVIGEDVRIGDRTRIEAQCYVGNGTTIGADCLLHPRVTVMEETLVGNRVILHPGVVLGADGFRYEATRGKLSKIPQVGRVRIDDDVEIGANTTIDRAFLRETRVGARTKIDNLVHIGHNVTIGSDCIIVAQVGMAGSVEVGRGVMMGGQVAIKDHVQIGDRAKIAGRTAVSSNLAAGSEVIGTPPVPLKDYARYMWFVRNFGSVWKKLKPLLDEDETGEDSPR